MAILVFTGAGSSSVYTTKTTLEAARTDDDCVGKTIVVATALTQAQSNISGDWPSDRMLEIKLGGSIANSTAFTFADGRMFTAGEYHVFKGAGTISGLREADPEWWGVDGTADDVQINAAINAITQGRVRLRATNYNCANFIFLKSDIELVGVGRYKTTLTQIGTGAPWTGFAAPSLVSNTGWNNSVVGNDRIAIRNIRVKNSYGSTFGSRLASGAIGGIYLGYVTNSIIDECEAREGWTGIAVYGDRSLTDMSNNIIRDCYTESCIHNQDVGNSGNPRGYVPASRGIIVQNCFDLASYTGFYPASTHNKFINCTSKGSQGDNAYYINSENCEFNNCRAIGPTGSGFAVSGADNVSFSGCVSESCTNMGFRLWVKSGGGTPTAMTGLRVENCRAYGCGYGLLVETSDRVATDLLTNSVISGNVFESNLFSGLMLRNSKHVIVTNNIIRNNNQDGVSASNKGGLALYFNVSKCFIFGNYIIDDQSSATQTVGFYNWTKAETGAAVENTENYIQGVPSVGASSGDFFEGVAQTNNVLANIIRSTGNPTLSAPKGTVYIKENGSGVADRVWINTDDGTTWTYLTTGA